MIQFLTSPQFIIGMAVVIGCSFIRKGLVERGEHNTTTTIFKSDRDLSSCKTFFAQVTRWSDDANADYLNLEGDDTADVVLVQLQTDNQGRCWLEVVQATK